MMSKGYPSKLGAVATGLAVALVAGAAMADLHYWDTPNTGTYQLAPGGEVYVSVTSGGGNDASAQGIGGSCVGWMTQAPDVRVNLSAGVSALIFDVSSDSDTTLVINDAHGQWHCNDDSAGTLNPRVIIPNAEAGEYDIWVGSFLSGGGASASLDVTTQ